MNNAYDYGDAIDDKKTKIRKLRKFESLMLRKGNEFSEISQVYLKPGEKN